jgi:hypothetical protein
MREKNSRGEKVSREREEMKTNKGTAQCGM